MVTGTITPQNTFDEKINVQDVRNVSIIGGGSGAELNGIGLRIINAGNIVVRNLRIHHVGIGEQDAISIHGPADHVWVDHCELYHQFQGALRDTYDGLIDAKGDVEYLTYSWNFLHDAWAPLLAGSTEIDLSDRKLTLHHNWISNVDGGVPSFRSGNAHVFNNLYEGVETMGINSRIGACVRVENNVFNDVTNPWVSAYSVVLGGVDLVCNQLGDLTTFDYSSLEVSEPLDCSASIPYGYQGVLNTTGSLSAVVKANTGVGKLVNPAQF